MVNLIAITSIITLSVNELKSPIKRQRLSDWIKKQDPTICYLQVINFKYRDTDTLNESIKKDISCKH